jgi:hypothetical protein
MHNVRETLHSNVLDADHVRLVSPSIAFNSESLLININSTQYWKACDNGCAKRFVDYQARGTPIPRPLGTHAPASPHEHGIFEDYQTRPSRLEKRD